MTINEKLINLRKESMILQKAYLSKDNYSEYLKIKKRQDKVYDKFLFFKNYVNAERKLK